MTAGGSLHEGDSSRRLLSFKGPLVFAPSAPGRAALLHPGKTLQPLLGASFLGGGGSGRGTAGAWMGCSWNVTWGA